MKRPLLKILPGVAVVLISPSCSKDNDIIKEDNAALVAEQVIQKKVFYLKVRNASSLTKMAIKGLGTDGNKELMFLNGDKLTITFDVKVSIYSSFTDYFEDNQQVTIVAEATYDAATETFIITDFTEDTKLSTKLDDDFMADYEQPAQLALEEICSGKGGAAEKYNVKLTWGKQIDLSTQKYIGYKNIHEMLAAAPRKAENCLTLQQDGDYCFIIFEEGSQKDIKIDGVDEPLDRSLCYIVAAGTEITVVDGGTSNTITTESGLLYNVKATPTKPIPDDDIIEEDL